MKKTPEEIKKTLEICSTDSIDCKVDCPFYLVPRDCMELAMADALEYIRQLEKEAGKC